MFVVPCSFFPILVGSPRLQSILFSAMEDIQELMAALKVPLFELSTLAGRGMLPDKSMYPRIAGRDVTMLVGLVRA